jgi:hypothetical protein
MSQAGRTASLIVGHEETYDKEAESPSCASAENFSAASNRRTQRRQSRSQSSSSRSRTPSGKNAFIAGRVHSNVTRSARLLSPKEPVATREAGSFRVIADVNPQPS